MSSFKQRSDLFKSIAMQSKLVAHNLLLSDGTRRNSYFRVNDIEELNSGIINTAHFPAIIHLGYEVRFKTPVGFALPQKIINNNLWFLSKLDLQTYPNKADAIEAAYDESFTVLLQFLSYLLHKQEGADCCCEFDFETAHSEMIGAEVSDLFGWHLTIQDSKSGVDLQYNPANWLGNPDEMPEEPEAVPQYSYADNDTAFIPYQAYENEKVIVWSNSMKARFGDNPTFQLWYQEGEQIRILTDCIIEPDKLPPFTTQYKIFITTPGPGVIAIKK